MNFLYERMELLMRSNQHLFKQATKEVKENGKEYMTRLIKNRGNHITTDKRYITEMTIKECLDEYEAIGAKMEQECMVYITIPEESSKKVEYKEEVEDLEREQVAFAKEIADRLTR
jgi:hypothetical protein